MGQRPVCLSLYSVQAGGGDGTPGRCDVSAPSLLSPSPTWLFLRDKTRREEPAQGRLAVKGARKLPEARPHHPVALCQSATPEGSERSVGSLRGSPVQPRRPSQPGSSLASLLLTVFICTGGRVTQRP